MRAIIALLAAVAAVALLQAAAAAEPSDACDFGDVDPAMTPTGLGLRTIGTPPTGTKVTACNTGVVVPAPGYVIVYGSGTGARGYVVVDGDSSFTALPCTDGYTAVEIDDGGPTFYHGADGNLDSSSTPRSPESFATALAGCAP